MPRCGGKKALPSELSGVRDLCKLPTDKTQRSLVIDFLRENRHYISMIAAAAAEIRARFAPELICVQLDIIKDRPLITVSAESEEVDVEGGIEDFCCEWYDPKSIDVGCIRFDTTANWASTRRKKPRLSMFGDDL